MGLDTFLRHLTEERRPATRRCSFPRRTSSFGGLDGEVDDLRLERIADLDSLVCVATGKVVPLEYLRKLPLMKNLVSCDMVVVVRERTSLTPWPMSSRFRVLGSNIRSTRVRNICAGLRMDRSGSGSWKIPDIETSFREPFNLTPHRGPPGEQKKNSPSCIPTLWLSLVRTGWWSRCKLQDAPVRRDAQMRDAAAREAVAGRVTAMYAQRSLKNSKGLGTSDLTVKMIWSRKENLKMNPLPAASPPPRLPVLLWRPCAPCEGHGRP